MKRSQAMLLVAGALALPHGAAASTAASPRQPKMAIDYPIPPFDVVDREGGPHAVPALDGLPMVLTFFASWCPPCRIEVPNMVAVARRYAGKLSVIGFDLYESEEKANAYIDDQKISFPVATLSTTDRDFFGKGITLPFGVLINKDGIIRDIWTGNEGNSNPLFGRLIRVGLQ
jgi:cytochrome c biogenesis protein CcmG/thiol:disulfide interchange protein DsbE